MISNSCRRQSIDKLHLLHLHCKSLPWYWCLMRQVDVRRNRHRPLKSGSTYRS
nr:MAG TPA: hypothetical protein [Caudoviricetes sp.]